MLWLSGNVQTGDHGKKIWSTSIRDKIRFYSSIFQIEFFENFARMGFTRVAEDTIRTVRGKPKGFELTAGDKVISSVIGGALGCWNHVPHLLIFWPFSPLPHLIYPYWLRHLPVILTSIADRSCEDWNAINGQALDQSPWKNDYHKHDVIHIQRSAFCFYCVPFNQQIFSRYLFGWQEFGQNTGWKACSRESYPAWALVFGGQSASSRWPTWPERGGVTECNIWRSEK
jgi:hypothetical protein